MLAEDTTNEKDAVNTNGFGIATESMGRELSDMYRHGVAKKKHKKKDDIYARGNFKRIRYVD